MSEEKIISQEDIIKFLDKTYENLIIDGIPVISSNIKDFANDYLKKHTSKREACKDLMSKQIMKCTTSGAVSGLGGIITMPIAVPANIANVLYVQMRMIACTAYMAGYDLKSDQTQTLVYMCLAGVASNQILKKIGIKVGEKVATNIVKKIPGKIIIEVNKKVGFRLLTKFGTKGAVNIWKIIPVVSSLIGGGLDYFETKLIALRSYKWFFENNFLDNDDYLSNSVDEKV